jgi:uncharacterized Fe-S cluster protein YjdI/CDGSH-type Zn-finger protein
MSETKKIQEFSNDKITVRFDPNICMHSGVCIRGLPTVFDIKRSRWIDVNGDTPERIMNLIKTCPSGALSYELKSPSEQSHAPAAETQPAEEKEASTVTITVATNSALRIAGKVRIVDLEGNLIVETEKCSLCRCGHSEKKPFCDGTHKKIGWQGEAYTKPVEC